MVRTFNVQHAPSATINDELQREFAMFANVTLFQEANDASNDSSFDLVQRPNSRHTLAVSLSMEFRNKIPWNTAGNYCMAFVLRLDVNISYFSIFICRVRVTKFI